MLLLPKNPGEGASPKAKIFFRDESGGGLAMGLFMFVTFAMLLALGMDFSNAWRNRTQLMSSADMAAHAGAVAIANGSSNAQIIADVKNSMEINMPKSLFGNVVTAATDIHLADYDIETKTFTSLTSTSPNAVVVEVYRTQARGNGVATTLLPLMGIDYINFDAVSAGVFDGNGICDYTDGIYAHGEVQMNMGEIGAGFCIHSEQQVWMPQQLDFVDNDLSTSTITSIVTMPDIGKCESTGKCDSDANPNIYPVEAHMVLGDYGQFIADTMNEFLAGLPMLSGSDKEAFFNARPLDTSAADLADLVLKTASLTTTPVHGQVIAIQKSEFESLSNPPSGLVYVVNDCPAGGNGPNTILTFDGATMILEELVLITNCTLDFQDNSVVRSSVVVTTRDRSTPSITSTNNVKIGDPTGSCVSGDRAYIMSYGAVNVPAAFGLSNVTLVVDDDINFASASSSGHTSEGFVIYASGEVKIAAQHSFGSCGDAADWLTPKPKVLRLVQPPIALL